MRQKNEDNLIKVVRAVVIDRMSPAECRELLGEMSESEVKALRSFAAWHQLEHIIDYAMYSDGDSPRSFDFYTSAAVTMQQSRAAVDLSAAFCREKIEHILLKGTVMRRMYPEEWMRNSCDVDVLVRTDDFERACAVLDGMGYAKQGVVTVHDIGYELECVRVELHYTLIEDYRIPGASRVLESVWECVKADDGGYAMHMSDELFYFYHIAHMAKHFGDGGCGMRSLVDLWLLNNCCEFDRGARDRLLTEGGVSAFEKKMRQLAEAWFGAGEVDSGLDFVEWYVLSGGAYGRVEMAEEVRVQRVGKVKYLCNRLFMPYSKLAKKYPSLEGRPYLTPIYEVRRWLEALFGNRKKYIGELKDSEHKGELVGMLRELGLEEFR